MKIVVMVSLHARDHGFSWPVTPKAKLVVMASSHAISHAQRVTRLYRKSLKNSLSWCIDRATWRAEALQIRARFDTNKHVQDRRLAQALVEKGEEELQNDLHPDPYIG